MLPASQLLAQRGPGNQEDKVRELKSGNGAQREIRKRCLTGNQETGLNGKSGTVLNGKSGNGAQCEIRKWKSEINKELNGKSTL